MDNAEKNWNSFAAEHEYNALDEAVSVFDTARGAMYEQTTLIMHGEGGNTQFEAGEQLERHIVEAANCFSDAALTIVAHTSDVNDAMELIANLFYTDETDRLTLLEGLNPEGEYPKSDPENLRLSIRTTLEEDEEDWHDIFEQLYGHACSFTINECLEDVPDNKIESENARRQARNEMIKRTASDIAKMAGAALLAVALTSHRKK